MTGAPGPKPDTSVLLSLDEYDRVIVSYSGGKDSLAALLHLLDLGVSRSKIELWHQHVDGAPGSPPFMDWPVTGAYVRATGAALGVPVRFQWREGGFRRELLKRDDRTAPVAFESEGGVRHAGGLKGKVATRRLFPQLSSDLRTRWCSSVLKIDVASAALNNDAFLRDARVLFVTGERREESPARARYAAVIRHRCSTRRRRVDQWRAVLDWSEAQVWATIGRWRVRPHPAYALGWGRVSCMACIFGDADQWASVRALAPAVFEEIAGLELEFGKTIRRGRTVVEQANAGAEFVSAKPAAARAAALAGTFAAEAFFLPPGEAWVAPYGAYRACGGPL